MPPQRIISLLPSATEIVCALGLQDELIGRSHECDYPPEVQGLPICSQPRFEPVGSSAAISHEVRTVLQEALSLYRVNVDRIRTLKPHTIITQSQCAVCAISTDELRAALHEVLQQDDIHIIDLNDDSLDSVLDNMQRVADTLGAHRLGEELVRRMRDSFAAVEGRAGHLPDKPRIAYLEWIEPMMPAGHWMKTLVTMAGGANVFHDLPRPRIGFDELVAQDPDCLFIAPCGFSIGRSLEDIHFLESHTAWQDLKAVRGHQVFIGDGNHYFNRPGPRLVDSLEILAEILHPELFKPQHRPSGWIRYEG
jgi:iron complex transport system substrate-binding protein